MNVRVKVRMRLPLVVGLAVGIGCSGGVEAAMERNSFLRSPATSVRSLVEQVRSRPEVMARYRGLYGVSSADILRYFRSQMRLAKLTRSGTYKVYYAKPNGGYAVNRLRLNAGTPVFVSLSGTPVLKASCGNPMIEVLPPQAVLTEPSSPAVIDLDVPTVLATVATAEPVNLMTADLEPPAPQETVAATQDVPGEPGAIPLPSPPSPPAIVVATPMAAMLSQWPWFAIVPAFGVVIGGDTPPVVAEPPALLVLPVGMALALGARRRRAPTY